MLVAATEDGVCAVARESEGHEAFTAQVASRCGETLHRVVLDDMPPVVAAVLRRGGVRSQTECGMPLDLAATTDFQRRVLTEVAAIPAGQTRSYGDVAEAVGSPGAARAVGGVMARNPLPFLIPCHRVVASDGSLGGYAYGLGVKRAMLASEGCLGQAA